MTRREKIGTGLALLGALLTGWGCAGRGSPGAAQGTDTVRAATDTAAAGPALSYEALQGKDIFDRYCAVCHGAGGAGDGFNSYNLDPKPHSLADSAYVAALSDRMLEQVIAGGGRGLNMSPEMPAYRGTLSPLEIAYLTAYIRSLAAGAGKQGG